MQLIKKRLYNLCSDVEEGFEQLSTETWKRLAKRTRGTVSKEEVPSTADRTSRRGSREYFGRPNDAVGD